MVRIDVDTCWQPGGPVLWWGAVSIGKPPDARASEREAYEACDALFTVHARASEREAYEACASYLHRRGGFNIRL